MIHLHQWAQRHGISALALAELQDIFTGVNTEPDAMSRKAPGSEGAVSNDVRLESGHKGVRLFRNNVGACQDKTGRSIRYGLANDSPQMNKRIKSSDLIGIRPLLITPQMVGSTVGQFVAREVKKSAWRYGADPEREKAQLAFISLVIGLGGDACFTNHANSL